MSDFKLDHARLIGSKLRAIRQQQRVSLRELAKKADISASMLSQIEMGKAYPSVRSIYSIAAALGVPVDYFFPDQDMERGKPSEDASAVQGGMTASEMREVTINRAAGSASSPAIQQGSILAQVIHASARPTILLKGGVSWMRLTATPEPDAEFLEITYAVGATSGENLSQHKGREFGLILEGELVIQLDSQRITLREGDSIVFDSMTPHRLENLGDKPMRALWVVWHQA
jgi:transcriptional regulator with XRE-family HTH domain/quercetin dioxygenase-like cupin family protein